MSTDFPHEPFASPTVLLNWPFNQVSGSGIHDEYNSGVIGTDASAPLSPPNVLQACAPPNVNGGGCQLDTTSLFAAHTTTQLFVGFWFFHNYVNNANGFNKIMFFQTASGLFGDNCYFMGYTSTWQPVFDLQSSRISNCHIPGAEWDAGCTKLPSTGSLPINTWTRIEIYIKHSTSGTSRDGTVEGWYMPFGGATVKFINLVNTVNWPGPVENNQINQTWDGASTWLHPDTACQKFDHWYISTGIAGGGPLPDTTPPAAPTGVTVS